MIEAESDTLLITAKAGVPLKDRLVSLMRDGYTPQQVCDDIRERNVKYLERTKTKSKKMRANP